MSVDWAPTVIESPLGMILQGVGSAGQGLYEEDPLELLDLVELLELAELLEVAELLEPVELLELVDELLLPPVLELGPAPLAATPPDELEALAKYPPPLPSGPVLESPQETNPQKRRPKRRRRVVPSIIQPSPVR